VIIGAHMLVYTPEPEAMRETLRDVFGFDFVEDTPGWLIFALPPAEVGVHPSEGATKHELCLMCDDLAATMDELRGEGIDFRGDVEHDAWGDWVMMALPGGVEMMLYEPRHQLAIST
jgi:catechol 2,3-dioxygenase-like lactoylglutathione lyase family enzyme